MPGRRKGMSVFMRPSKGGSSDDLMTDGDGIHSNKRHSEKLNEKDSLMGKGESHVSNHSHNNSNQMGEGNEVTTNNNDTPQYQLSLITEGTNSIGVYGRPIDRLRVLCFCVFCWKN